MLLKRGAVGCGGAWVVYYSGGEWRGPLRALACAPRTLAMPLPIEVTHPAPRAGGVAGPGVRHARVWVAAAMV